MLSPKQYKAIEAHFTSNTVAEIACKAAVHPKTILGWRKQQEFSEELEKQKKEFDKVFSRRLLGNALKALKMQEFFISDKNETVTIKTIDQFLKSKCMDESEEIKREMAELRNLVEEKENASKGHKLDTVTKKQN